MGYQNTVNSYQFANSNKNASQNLKINIGNFFLKFLITKQKLHQKDTMKYINFTLH